MVGRRLFVTHTVTIPSTPPSARHPTGLFDAAFGLDLPLGFFGSNIMGLKRVATIGDWCPTKYVGGVSVSSTDSDARPSMAATGFDDCTAFAAQTSEASAEKVGRRKSVCSVCLRNGAVTFFSIWG